MTLLNPLQNKRATQTSPHARSENRTGKVMKLVMLAAIPGLAAQTAFFGWGTLVNVIWCGLMAVACEALVLKLRHRPLGFYLKDNSALVTGILLALAIPPFSPWWLSLVGVSFAMIIGKHLYGGLGQNPFNPAHARLCSVADFIPTGNDQLAAANGR